jgi:hypothetical protein
VWRARQREQYSLTAPANDDIDWFPFRRTAPAAGNAPDGSELASLFELGVRRFETEAVQARTFRYSVDPRHSVEIRRAGGNRGGVSVSALPGDRETQRLLVLGPTAALFDSRAAQPEPWAVLFSAWSTRAVLDIAARRDRRWTTPEIALTDSGWRLGEAKDEAISVWSRAVDDGRVAPALLTGAAMSRQETPPVASRVGVSAKDP